jgi:uncharacterized iron-regulated membrane protein
MSLPVRRIVLLVWCFAGLFAACAGNTVQCSAAETAPPQPTSSQPAGAEDAEASPEEVARRRKLRLAILTGGLIGVTGLALVLLTILGGSATRRSLRRKPLTGGPLPPEPLPAERFDDPEPSPGEAPDTNEPSAERRS